jgi:hypothetical protein
MNENDKRCKHCGARIVLTNYALGPSWEHVDGIEIRGYRFCKSSVAEPEAASL